MRAAAGEPGSAGCLALDRVLSRYAEIVVRYLGFRFSISPEDAEDLWQSFVLKRVLEKRLFDQADAQRGRFRTFLLSALNRYVVSEYRRQNAQKRCPPGGSVSLDTVGEWELTHLQSKASDDGELNWAQAVLAGALLNMRAECDRIGALEVWGVFDGRVLSAILTDQAPTDYAQLVRRFGFKSPKQTFNALTSAKRMFKRHLRQVIAQYSADDTFVDEELEHLRRMLGLPD